ncbi:MAG: phasin family protein [Nitrospirota bacterium]
MTINDMFHKALMAGLGVPEKLKDLIDDLVKKGELSESQGAKLVKECTEKAAKSGEDISKSIADLIKMTMEKMNIPSRDEVEELNRKVKSLSLKIRKLEGKSKSDNE